MFDQSVINYEVYEDNNTYLGITDTTLPNISFLTQTISGAGIGGNVDAVITSMVDAMNLTFNWRMSTPRTFQLAEPRSHTLTLRVAQQYEDPVAAALGVESVKHVLRVIPKNYNFGALQAANPNNGSGEYAVRYWAVFSNGKKLIEIDPLNNKCLINGVDYAAPVRKALGKA